MPHFDHLPLYIKFYQFIKFLYGVVRVFPKEHKYSLGADVLNISWQCIDSVLEANSLPNQEKKAKIAELSIVFDKFKIRLRICQELNLISKKQFVHIQTYFIQEIGKMIGGWLKWSNERNI